MKITFLKIFVHIPLFFSALTASAQNIPKCEAIAFATSGSIVQGGLPYSRCIGKTEFSNGDYYVGELNKYASDGKGVLYQKDGTVLKSGIWSNGIFLREAPIEVSSAPNLNEAKIKCTELGFKSGTESFGKCVLKISK